MFIPVLFWFSVSTECGGANPCQNGATCVRQQGDLSCLCVPGFSGDQCEISMCNKLVQNQHSFEETYLIESVCCFYLHLIFLYNFDKSIDVLLFCHNNAIHVCHFASLTCVDI